jgi:septation ring formation regulator EzrA
MNEKWKVGNVHKTHVFTDNKLNQLVATFEREVDAHRAVTAYNAAVDAGLAAQLEGEQQANGTHPANNS